MARRQRRRRPRSFRSLFLLFLPINIFPRRQGQSSAQGPFRFRYCQDCAGAVEMLHNCLFCRPFLLIFAKKLSAEYRRTQRLYHKHLNFKIVTHETTLPCTTGSYSHLSAMGSACDKHTNHPAGKQSGRGTHLSRRFTYGRPWSCKLASVDRCLCPYRCHHLQEHILFRLEVYRHTLAQHRKPADRQHRQEPSHISFSEYV